MTDVRPFFINTRPAERANDLSIALRQRGYTVEELPLLALQAEPLDALLQQQYQQLMQADLIVAVSSSAVKIGIAYYQQLDLPWSVLQHKTWLAIGTTTQRALAQHGLEAICPALETSEGALQLPLLQQCQQRTVAFWRGHGGRVALIRHLQAQQCHIINMLLYRRQPPAHSSEQLQQIAHYAQQASVVVLISSEYSFRHWCQLFAGQLHQFGYIVLGERVTQLVASQLEATGQGWAPHHLQTILQISTDQIDHAIIAMQLT